MLALVRMEGLGGRRPHQLSGGQRARVALARALAKRPKLLLLDEPLSALDKSLRESMQFELVNIQERTGTTFVVVTHDQAEAMTVAGRLGVMQHGRLAQVGTPAEVYEAPASRFVAEFFGNANILEGVVAESGPGACRIALPAGGAVLADAPAPHPPGSAVLAVIRPERLRLSHAAPDVAPGENRLVGRVRDIAYQGDVFVYFVAVEGGPVLRVSRPNVTRTTARPAEWEERVEVTWDAHAAVVLPA
jgi:putrescine transport system ATP-binding protein